ncbi:MFS transporter [Candidatus Finniella inopinata]|uniref:MFS transporter n=1 Tax=Candidatus Finniella inopinata TaxID=1696036 RepID=A0A4Q7DGE4_9PROT|nr:MFS transporter [Candidatus Finniella inopinata]RZI45931.1 MFS transporter [Candidatus Finniella inopinata]
MAITYIGNFIDFLEFGLFTALLPFISKDLLGLYDPQVRAEFCYLAVFAGFLGRPVGAYFLGKFGDLYGSQRLLVFSVLGISVASMILAFLPTNNYYVIEMIILCRFLQGLFTGAEYSAVVVSATQTATVRSSYRSVALMTASGVLGVSVAQFMAFLLSLFHLENFTWRYAFVFVSMIGFCTFLKRALSYKKDWVSVIRPEVIPLRNYIPEIFSCIILVGLVNAMFYLVNTFVNTYKMIISSNLATSQFLLNFITTSCFALSIWLWSIYLSSRDHQPFKIMQCSLLSMVLLLGPLFYAYVEGTPLWISAIIQVVFISGIQLFTVVGISFVPRLFPASIRIQACGLGFNLGISLLGGGFPYLSLKLTEKTHSLYAPAFAALSVIFVGYLSLRVLRKRYPEMLGIKCSPIEDEFIDENKPLEKISKRSYK